MKGIVLFEDSYCLLPVNHKGQTYWAKVDWDVALWAVCRSWCVRSGKVPYPCAKIAGKVESLHVLVNGTPPGLDTDHVNHDPLDNRRANLRSATRSQNNGNRQRTPNKTSPVKGVSWVPSKGKWLVQVKSVRYGLFTSHDEAAAVARRAAIEHFGEFACERTPA